MGIVTKTVCILAVASLVSIGSSQERKDREERARPKEEKAQPKEEKAQPKEEKAQPGIIKGIFKGPAGIKRPALPYGCKHDITFQKLDASAQATQIRVKPYSGGAIIQNPVAAPGWTLTSSTAGVVFKPQGGGVIPTGSHPGFSINIRSNNQGQQWVLVEWLTATGATICGQPLYVPCTLLRARAGQAPVVEPVPVSAPQYNGPACGCLNAFTGADDTSDILDSDIDVTINQITNAGFLKFKVLYAIELDPPGMSINLFNKTWRVVKYDANDNEVALNIQPTSDTYNPQTGQGQATFTITEGGEFDVTLKMTSKLSCLNNPEQGGETLEDEDTEGYVSTEMTTRLAATPSSPCDYLTYAFKDDSNVPGINPQWTVNGQDVTNQLDAAGNYTFPAGNVAYTVCLQAYDSITDPITNITTVVARAPECQTITPVQGQPTVAFEWSDYNSCTDGPYGVTFTDKSQNAACPLTRTWTFKNLANNTVTTSTAINPYHVFATAGYYEVTLDLNGTTTTKTIHVYKWEPTIDPPVANCGDGSITWSTQSGATNEDRTWLPPADGSYNPNLVHEKQLRVCYATPGLKSMNLEAVNADGGKCIAKMTVMLGPIERCCRRDKDKDSSEFTVGGKQYRMKYKIRFRGTLGRVFVKTKLQVKKSGIWRRTRATNISASFVGTVYSKNGECKCAIAHTVSGQRSHNNRAKVSKLTGSGTQIYRIRQGSVTSTHRATIGGHTETKTLTLWKNDCGCGWKN